MDDKQRMLGFNGDILIVAGTEYGPAATGVGKVVDKTPEWIICPTGISVVTLEEYINGISTDVLSEHGLTGGVALPDNYILKSVRGAGFSRIKLTGGNSNGFILSPQKLRNNKFGPQSGIFTSDNSNSLQ